ncbi:MAG: sulfotransferase domain-containing protein [Chloroflexaceae bacterium]|nr:sulfotransferase domain-containing protein [Chloroflexaceae bacterium]
MVQLFEVAPIQQQIQRLKQKFTKTWRNPFANPRKQKLIIHCSHHKAGTVWFSNVLKEVANQFGLQFQYCRQEKLYLTTEIFLEDHSCLDFEKLPPHRGSHIIRDPRDMIISGYFYHLWTHEKWANIPRQKYGDRSYKDYLNSLDLEAGILAEIKRAINGGIKEMSIWDYTDPNFINIKYEDLVKNEREIFSSIFRHYGFHERAIAQSLEIVDYYSFKNVKKREAKENFKKSHLRSGRSGEWRELFTDAHKAYFKEHCGDILLKLGYETNYDW